MKKFNRQSFDAEKGLALLALIVIMLILGLVAYTFVNIVSTHQYASQVPHTSLQAFYLTEGALEIGKKYVDQIWDSQSYPTWYNQTLYYEVPLGDGTFSVWVTGTSMDGFVEFDASGDVSY